MRRLVVAVVLVALVGIAGGACGGDEEEQSGGSPPVSLEGKTNDHGTKTASGTVEVELDDFYYGPTFIKATAGQQITIELKNEGKVPHTFSSPALGVDEELAAGATKKVTVTAPQSGNAVFSCRFHVSLGMQGAIVVA